LTVATSRRSCDSLSTQSACRLLKSDDEAADGSSDEEVDDNGDVADSLQSLGVELQSTHDNDDSSSTSTNVSTFSEHPHLLYTIPRLPQFACRLKRLSEDRS